MKTFASLGLPDHLLNALRDVGFKAPTPVQAGAIPPISAGRDVAGEAQTGSGKTAAFVLPILKQLAAAPPGRLAPVRVLALAPTRELALQVAAVFERLARRAPRPIKVLSVIGGVPIEQQADALWTGVDVVVATPGRLLDLLDRRLIDLSSLQTLVLDEADKLLDLGFQDALNALFAAVPTERQTLLFSATLPQRVIDLSARVLRDPVTVRVDAAPVGPDGIHQRVIEVPRHSRRMLLQHLLHAEGWDRTLIFVATQRASDNLAAKLRKAGFSATALHGGLAQADRVAVLAQFADARVPIMVATDIAARGIDVPAIGVVVNFDLPRSPRDYLHRIGRTGRAGATGVAVSFIDHTSAAHFRLIETRSQIALVRERIPGFELSATPPAPRKGPAPTKGKRMSKKDKLRAARAAGAQEEPPCRRS